MSSRTGAGAAASALELKDVAELLNDPSLNDSSGIVSDFLRATCCTFSAASSIAAFVAAMSAAAFCALSRPVRRRRRCFWQ